MQPSRHRRHRRGAKGRYQPAGTSSSTATSTTSPAKGEEVKEAIKKEETKDGPPPVAPLRLKLGESALPLDGGMSIFALSDDPSVVAEYTRAGWAELDAGLELAELLRAHCDGTPYDSWMGPLRRFCGRHSHPEFVPARGPLRDNRQVFKVPCFSERHNAWPGDAVGQYTSASVGFVTFFSRAVNAARVGHQLLRSVACLYPRVLQRLRNASAESAPLPADPLLPFLELCEAVQNVLVPLDMTMMQPHEPRAQAEVWSAVYGNTAAVVEWWRRQIRRGSFPPGSDLDDPDLLASAHLAPFSYIPCIADLNLWVQDAWAGGLSRYPGAEPYGPAAASWSMVAMLASSLLAEVCRMLAGLGVVTSTHVTAVPKLRQRELAKVSWRVCWDVSMGFFKQPDHVVTAVGISQHVGQGRVSDRTVRCPSLNGRISKAFGEQLHFARRVRDAFLLRRDGKLASWPEEREADELLRALTIPLAYIPETDAWEFSSYGFMMLSLASVGPRSRRRPLLYLPPFRWDVLLVARHYMTQPRAIEAPVDIASAQFTWESTNVMVRANADGSGSGKGDVTHAALKRTLQSVFEAEEAEQATEVLDAAAAEGKRVIREPFLGGALHVTSHTVEAIRPLSFEYVGSSRRARKVAARNNADSSPGATGRLHAQVRSVVVNPCAWGSLAAVL